MCTLYKTHFNHCSLIVLNHKTTDFLDSVIVLKCHKGTFIGSTEEKCVCLIMYGQNIHAKTVKNKTWILSHVVYIKLHLKKVANNIAQTPPTTL